MSLQDKLMEDLKSAMKNKEKTKKDVVTLIRSDIKQKEVDERVEVKDDDIIDIIAKQIKQRQDSIGDFEKANRDDLVDKMKEQIKILLEYLPEQLSDNELTELVIKTINDVGATGMKDMGKIMGSIMPKIKGKADGSKVNIIVKEYFK